MNTRTSPTSGTLGKIRKATEESVPASVSVLAESLGAFLRSHVTGGSGERKRPLFKEHLAENERIVREYLDGDKAGVHAHKWWIRFQQVAFSDPVSGSTNLWWVTVSSTS